MRTLAKWSLWTAAALLGVALLLMLALKIALDRVPAYQNEIKAWVHAQTGYHIAFARVSPTFRWYGPELHFDNLELRSKDDRRVLARAASGRIAADVWQLLKSGKLLAGRIELNAPTIVIARLGPMSFALASEIKLGGGSGTLESISLDDLPAGILAIRHAVVTLEDWNPALARLTLSEVNLDARRGDGALSIALRARLPDVLGGTFFANAMLRGRGDFDVLDWNALLSARDISFAGWRLLLPEYLAALSAGRGAFDLAARGTGRTLAHGDLHFGAREVITQANPGAATKFEQISGELDIAHAGERYTLAGRRLRALRAGQRDPESQFDVTWRAGDGGEFELTARANYLRAESFLPLTGFVPDEQFRERLQRIAPSGELLGTALAVRRSGRGAPLTFDIQAQFRDAGYAPIERAPGLRGLSGTLAGNERGGRLSVEGRGARFYWPAQLAAPVPLEQLRATVYWRRSASELLIASQNFSMSNQDGAVRAKAAWRQHFDGSSPELTLAATLDNGTVQDARLYLPRALLPPRVLAWLDRAFIAGRVPHADIVLRGPIKHFPFRDGSGLFLVRCPVQGLSLDYQEGWPRAENLSGIAEFRNEGLDARATQGRIGGVSLDAVQARFDDFKSAELELHVQSQGDAADALSYLRASPLDALADHAFSSVEARGTLDATVDLFLPFKDFANRRVAVRGRVAGASLGRLAGGPVLSELNGEFEVDGAQISRADIHGRLLGGNFQLQARAGRARPLSRTLLEMRGVVGAEALRSALGAPSTLALSGQSEWHASLRIAPEPNRERSLRVSSSLVGLELGLPEPLAKSADAPMPSWLEIQWPAGGPAQGRFALGSLLSGAYRLSDDASAVHLAHLGLSFGGGEPSMTDAQLLSVSGTVPRLDLGGWLKLVPSGKGAKPVTDYVRSARFGVAELDYGTLALKDLSFDLALAERALHLKVGGANVKGSLTLPLVADSGEAWNLQFERLRVEAAAEQQKQPNAGGEEKHSSAAAIDPHTMPAVDFHAAELDWAGRHFGDVRAVLVKEEEGIELKSLAIQGGSFAVQASGQWRGRESSVGAIQGILSSTDVQETLKELGYLPVIQAKDGHINFELEWHGAPTESALSQATGHLKVALDNGQLVGLKPGAGRVLGLTSVAALRRRLALDFSDLTDKGLAFDTARGDFDLHDGSAYTDDVLVKGPAAEIGLIGRIGLKNRDYDQTAVVTGSIGNSLPLAALAGGPVVGAAVLLFTQVFKQPLKGLARGYYRITGSWDNPIVERIKSADAAAAAAEAPK